MDFGLPFFFFLQAINITDTQQIRKTSSNYFNVLLMTFQLDGLAGFSVQFPCSVDDQACIICE